MAWRERIVEGFPPPYRGEPASLRRDIEDELADHLAFATERELERTGNEPEARRAALERFGNPRAVARQLWFEAMKERIMKDRIMTVAMSLLAIAAIVGGVFAFKAFEQSRETSRAMIAALEKLATMGERETLVATETATATFKVVDVDGKPLEGVAVGLSGQPFNEKAESISVMSDREGVSKFGPIKMGKYTVTISIGEMESSDFITLYQGKKYEETIVVPEIPMAKIKPRIELPEDLRQTSLLLLFEMCGSHKTSSNRTWSTDYERYVVTGDGKVFDYTYSDNKFFKLGKEHENGEILIPMTTVHIVLNKLKYAPNGISDQDEITIVYRDIYEFRGRGYEVVNGQLYKNNVLEKLIKISEPLLKSVRWGVVSSRDNQNQEIDKGLISKIDGRIVGVRQVTKDCSIIMKYPSHITGGESFFDFYDKEGGSRILVDWADVDPEYVADSSIKYLLAYYSGQRSVMGYRKGLRDGTGAVPKIFAHKILEDWVELTSWNAMPNYEEEPAAEYAVVPERRGWKLFDVTAFVKEQADAKTESHGLMLRFDKESEMGSNTKTLYELYTRENTGSCQPLLLIVEPDEVEGKE